MTRGNAALAMLLVFIVVPLLQQAVAQNYVPHATDYFEPEEYTAASPCKKHRPGDPDLTTYDIISSFRFDEFHSRNEGVQQIIGSTGFQTAYHLEEYANMTIASTQAFPKGVPNEFSFECTFRVPQQQPRNEWYLFELTDYRYESQMSVTINPIHNTIDFSLPKYDGTVQTISFEETEIFDRSWHKVMFGITQDAVRLWIDCKPVPDLSGTFRAPLDVRGPIDASEGAFSIARDCRTKSTVPIDVQWMIFSCDAEKPARSNCQDLPLRGTYVTMQEPLRPTPPTRPLPSLPPFQFSTETTRRPLELFFEQTTSEQPWLLSSTPSALVGQESNVCPEQCPRGLPGPSGPPGVPGATGLPGLMGEPGPVGPPGELTNIQESAEYVPPLKGEKGERGQPGQMGPAGPPGPPGPPATQTADNAGVEPSTRDKRPTDTPKSLAGLDEREVRDICMAVVREYITEYTSTLTGPPGSPGLRGPRGHPGAQGIQGEPGVRGATGERGYPGLPGQQGPAGDMGLPGPEGQKGERGEDGIGREGPIGPPGPPGDAGRPGRKGQTGHPGERGEVGAQGIQGIRGPPGPAGVCPDCSAQTAQYMYPLMLAQQQYSNKGPQGYYNNKGPQEYYNNKGPQEHTKG